MSNQGNQNAVNLLHHWSSCTPKCLFYYKHISTIEITKTLNVYKNCAEFTQKSHWNHVKCFKWTAELFLWCLILQKVLYITCYLFSTLWNFDQVIQIGIFRYLYCKIFTSDFYSSVLFCTKDVFESFDKCCQS